jgi:predicted TIM-barrel fold metal-dependent hydrolase
VIDVNVCLARWPFRRLPCEEPAALVAKLRKCGVTQAWTGSFDGVFHKDIASANARLAAACRASGKLLLPFGTVNPKLPDWREDFRRCAELHKMQGLRLHPNYHGYTLDDPSLRELLKLAADRKLIVQLALCMEDERTQHPLMRVPPVDIAPLRDTIAAEPRLKLIVVNCYPQMQIDRLRPLSLAGQVYFDTSMTERVDGVNRLGAVVSPERVVFGSYSPFFNPESALLKVEEAGLTGPARTAMVEGNARQLLAR